MELIKLTELMDKEGIPKDEDIDMIPLTKWYVWNNFIFVAFKYAYEYELNEKWALVSYSKIPKQKEIDEFFKGYKVLNGEIEKI